MLGGFLLVLPLLPLLLCLANPLHHGLRDLFVPGLVSPRFLRILLLGGRGRVRALLDPERARERLERFAPRGGALRVKLEAVPRQLVGPSLPAAKLGGESLVRARLAVAQRHNVDRAVLGSRERQPRRRRVNRRHRRSNLHPSLRFTLAVPQNYFSVGSPRDDPRRVSRHVRDASNLAAVVPLPRRVRLAHVPRDDRASRGSDAEQLAVEG